MVASVPGQLPIGAEGEFSHNVALQQKALEAWHSTGILTAEDKQVLGSKSVVELGVRIDGINGLVGASSDRIFKTSLATMYHLLNPVWSKKEAQIIMGRWIFILQYRRAAMGVLSKAWRCLESKWPQATQIRKLHQELLQLLCLGPLLQGDLTSEYDGQVTCSDASESGGAAAISRGLSWSGQSYVVWLSDSRLHGISCPVLLISLFNGIGGTFRIYDILGVIPHRRIAVDVSKQGNRVTRTTWPDVIELHDANNITKDEIRRWANLFAHVSEVHVFGSFPCVHLSSARANRLNLEGEGSNLFWKLVEFLQWIHEIFGSFCKVKHCVENVASMDEDARMAISDELGIMPVKLDPADCMPVSRPRLAWCSVPLYEMTGIEFWKEREYVRAYVSAEPIDNCQWIRPGWRWDAAPGTTFPTFMKCIKRVQPPVQPAGLRRASADTRARWASDHYRYPPYQHGPQFLLHCEGQQPRLLDSSVRELLLGFGPAHTASCMSASDMKKSKEVYEDSRCSLCGDSFSILSFGIMASSMCSEMVPRMTPDQMVKRLGLAPGSSAHPEVQGPMSRWLCYGGNTEVQFTEKEMVQQLGLSVNHTGCDVRIVTGEAMGQKAPSHASVKALWSCGGNGSNYSILNGVQALISITLR